MWDLLALLNTLKDKGSIPTEESGPIKGEYREGNQTKLEDVSIVTPDGLVLVEGLRAWLIPLTTNG